MPSYLTLTVFVAVVLGILGIGGLLFDVLLKHKSRVDSRIKAAFRDQARKRALESPLFRDLERLAEEGGVAGPTLEVRMETLLAQAGLTWSAAWLLAAIIAGAVVFALVAALLSRSWWFVVPAAAVGGVLPVAQVFSLRRRRMKRLCQQLPEAFEVMARSLRAGQTVPVAFQVVANEFSAPIAEEFAHCFEQQHLGIPYEVALRDLARRTGFIETQIFAAALIINRQIGGNLAEVLARLAETMRKRAQFHARVHALTSEGRMQAAVLMALPVTAFALLMFLDRNYAQALIDRPLVLGGTAVSQLIGAVCIRRIINVRY